MVVELNLESLDEMGLTPNEFVFLTLIKQGADDEAALISKYHIDLESLQTNGWIKVWEGRTVIRDKFISNIEDDFDRMWHDLLSRYPIKVFSKDGVRVLRAGDPESKSNLKAKARYQKVVKTDITKHSFIMKCLERELLTRRTSNSLGYMQLLDTWVNNHSWDKYADESYGKSAPESDGNRITRQL